MQLVTSLQNHINNALNLTDDQFAVSISSGKLLQADPSSAMTLSYSLNIHIPDTDKALDSILYHLITWSHSHLVPDAKLPDFTVTSNPEQLSLSSYHFRFEVTDYLIGSFNEGADPTFTSIVFCETTPDPAPLSTVNRQETSC